MSIYTDKISRKISFGKFAICSSRKVNAVEAEIEVRKLNNGKLEFSAMAMVWDAKHSDILIGGQCFDSILGKCPKLADNDLFMKIVHIWRRNHLNGMHAGTPAQEKIIDEWVAKGNLYDYSKACDVLKLAGLYEDNGYKYGSGWVYHDISDKDMFEILKLIALN